MIPFYQRISGTNFEICFSRSCSPNLVTKQTYFGNFTRLQTHFGCQNREASTEETWWHCFCIFHSSFFTDFCHSTNRNQICSVSEHVLSHRRNVASLTLFYRYYFGRCSSELTQLVPLHFLERGPLVILIDCTIFLWPFLNVTSMSMSTVSFLTQLDSGILCL